MKKDIISQVMTHEVFRNQPPVLVDVGASGEVHKEWAQIAPFAVCIAFDGDDRELEIIQNSSGYRKLILCHRVLSAVKGEYTDFYLTSSPYCSSTLEPNKEGVSPYHFAPFFEIEKNCS